MIVPIIPNNEKRGGAGALATDWQEHPNPAHDLGAWLGRMTWAHGLGAWPGRMAWAHGLGAWPGRMAWAHGLGALIND